ncbi:MAG: hypothetical protein WBG58_10555 [Ignavibacteriaceae bacterium]
MKILKIIFFLVVYSTILFSQSSSTYTRYGIGDISYTYSARSLGLAQTGVATLNQGFVEILNPASWASLQLTRIEFSLVLNGVQLSDNSNSALYTDGEFKGFTFAFPISKKLGIGFASGLLPYSRISYNVVQSNTADETHSSNYTETYEGDGGLSKLFMGASVKIPFDWIFGATLEYYFGKRTYSSTINFDDQSFLPAEYELDYRSTGFGTTVGLISQNFASLFNSESISNLRLGVSVNLLSDLDTDTSLTINPTNVADTIFSGKTQMSVPMRITAGLTLQLSNAYSFNLDYIYQPWSEYSVAGVTSSFLRDVNKIGLGFEYKPVAIFGRTSWELIMWRAGVSYEQTQYIINGTGINQISVFAGLTLPLGFGDSLDLGLEFSQRGTLETNLIEENFFRINIGISFGELWFQRAEK